MAYFSRQKVSSERMRLPRAGVSRFGSGASMQKKIAWTCKQSDYFGHWMLSNWLPWLERQTDEKHREWAKSVEGSIRRLERKYPSIKRLTR